MLETSVLCQFLITYISETVLRILHIYVYQTAAQIPN